MCYCLIMGHHFAAIFVLIFAAREMGYESVAHLLMDELKRANR